jgi:hypothetical protein
MAKHSKITSFHYHGQILLRAHVWTDKGYSTNTFATSGEAHNWIMGKTND